MKVLITGTSRGIGRATAELFLNKGHEVVGLDIAAPTLAHPHFTHITADVRGELPEAWKETIELAILECLINTVKHAKGKRLDVTFARDGGFYTVSITNDGEPPKGTVRETGGLANLRTLAVRQGAEMTVESKPGFRLILRPPLSGGRLRLILRRTLRGGGFVLLLRRALPDDGRFLFLQGYAPFLCGLLFRRLLYDLPACRLCARGRSCRDGAGRLRRSRRGRDGADGCCAGRRRGFLVVLPLQAEKLFKRGQVGGVGLRGARGRFRGRRRRGGVFLFGSVRLKLRFQHGPELHQRRQAFFCGRIGRSGGGRPVCVPSRI